MSVNRIKGQDGVVLESNAFLEVPKAQSKVTAFAERAGMFRYNKVLKAFEGVLEFDDGSLSYRRFPSLDNNGKLSSSTLPDSVVSGMQYMGTYSVISDDMDPPLGTGLYHPLPAASSTNSGNYFIVRGLLDAAIAHFKANNPTTTTVKFTPVNPSGQGNWIEIKYYIAEDPVRPTEKMVTASFGRIIKTSIPASGHAGLLSLSTNPELTNAFTASTDPNTETAFMDGDWVISNGTTQQRLRSTRTSILASQVLYDRSFINSIGRAFDGSAGTSQTALDNLQAGTIRRSGDSMYVDPDSPASGRLAFVYGSAAKPSLTFTSGVDDLTNNSGLDPTKWTDAGTGIFRQNAGSIGFSSNATERFRIENTKTILFQTSSTVVSTNPALQFNHSSNTNNVGISGINNSISFSIKNAEQVKFEDNLSTFNGSIIVTDNTTLGTNSTNTLLVNSTSTFKSAATFEGNVTIGLTSAQALTVNSNTTLNGSLVTKGNNFFEKDVRIKYNSGVTFVPDNPTLTGTVRMTSDGTSGLGIYLSNADYNVSVYEPGNVKRMYIGRYGIKLPVLNPVVNTVGEDGQVAYSTSLKSVVVKIDGEWTKVGAGMGMETTTFLKANWVDNGQGLYTFTVAVQDPLSVIVQEKNANGSYTDVGVDTINYTTTNVTIGIPNGTPDLRFDGRIVVTVSS